MTKKLVLMSLAILLLAGSAFTVATQPKMLHLNKIKAVEPKFQVGDLIFQTSNSSQSKAIQLATDSKFSHVGMIVSASGKLMVLEAVQPVKLTSINEFIARGTNSEYTIKRLKAEYGTFTEEKSARLERVFTETLGKNYDIYFNWSDKEFYCSELVWKMYFQVMGVKLSEPKPLKSYHLDHPLVKEQMKARYGDNIPMDEVMVSPQDLFESTFLE